MNLEEDIKGFDDYKLCKINCICADRLLKAVEAGQSIHYGELTILLAVIKEQYERAEMKTITESALELVEEVSNEKSNLQEGKTDTVKNISETKTVSKRLVGRPRKSK